jgi:hypothetical protein
VSTGRAILTVNTALPSRMPNIQVSLGMEPPKVNDQVVINSAATLKKLGIWKVPAVNQAARTYDIKVLQ